jgi:hypothetical protein
VLLIVAVNAPQYVRCYELTGTPLGLPLPVKSPRYELTTHHWSAAGILANALRNISLHTATPSPTLNLRIEHVFRFLIRGLGQDPDSRDAVWLDWPFKIGHVSSYEMDAGNPVHLVLLFISIVLVFIKARHGANREALWFCLGLVASFLFFSATLLWTVWSSRYQLPFFVVGSALVGLSLERLPLRRITLLASIALLVPATILAATNKTRSLVPWSRVEDVYHRRELVYFFDEHKDVAAANIAAASMINQTNCKGVAIDSFTESQVIGHGPRSFYVYPLLALIHGDGRTRRVHYDGVQNLTRRYEREAEHSTPCAVVCFDCANVNRKWDEYRKVGGRASVFDYIVVFSSQGTVPNLPQPSPVEKRLQ